MYKPKVIIVGAGFAGIVLTRKLDENIFDVLLIDKINHHQFQPLFYQVATSQLEPSSISFPLRKLFNKNSNVKIRLAEVERINESNNTIDTNIGFFTYDYLIIATGCTSNFFGNKNISEFVFTLKSTYDAIAIRNHILQTFENIISANEKDKESLLNVVIVGAGPTGVELTGAFAEIKRNILPKDYPGINFSQLKIILIEGSEHTLNSMSNDAKIASQIYLEKMGVDILTKTFVSDYDGETLTLKNGNRIKSKTVIWAAGVKANKINGLSDTYFTIGNRLKVDSINKINSTRNIFAIGDIALMQTIKYPNGHPQLANVAIQQAKNLASNLKRVFLNKSTNPFIYKDFGTMATIGTNKAVVDLPFIHFKGYLAWFTWMFLHLMLILNVKNKLIIFINWTWAYITKDTSLRLILTQKNNEKNIPLH